MNNNNNHNQNINNNDQGSIEYLQLTQPRMFLAKGKGKKPPHNEYYRLDLEFNVNGKERKKQIMIDYNQRDYFEMIWELSEKKIDKK